MSYFTRLGLTDFRSYKDASITPGPGLVILTGENGAGKTNLIEAASFFAPGRGLRQASLSEVARQQGNGGFTVSARTQSPGGLGEFGTGTTASAPERRQLRVNGASAPLTSLGEWLSILWLTPAMDRLFTEGASGRRRFLDRLTLALYPVHATHASRYEAAMRARNRLLSDENTPDPTWLTALEAQMAEHGTALAQARLNMANALDEQLRTQADGPFARASIAITGWQIDDTPDAESFAAALLRARPVDRAAGRTLAGPHRSDIDVRHAEKNQLAGLCSTGEQKALLLGLILAHADLVAHRRGDRPILLLDEVAAHLDPRRRAALFDRLSATGGQVWMTGTEAALFAEAGDQASRFHIAASTITPY